MITLTGDIPAVLDRGDTLVVPSAQRAHAVRVAHARQALARGQGAWPTADVLSGEAWIAREVTRVANADARVPRALSAAEDWWLWRTATARATSATALGSTAALADSLRRADRLAAEYGIDLARWRAVGGRETQLLDEVRRAVAQARRELGADTVANIAAAMDAPGSGQPVHFAGFAPGDAPRLRAIHARRAKGWGGEWWPVGEPRAAPGVERCGDEADEVERIAAWCLQRLGKDPAARVLVVSASGLERREALAAQVRATLAPASKLAGRTAEGLVAVEGGAPLARQPLVQHSLASLGWLIDGLEFEAFTTWLRSPCGNLAAGAAARLDLWWRRHAPIEADARASLGLLDRAAAGGVEAAAMLAARTRAALAALGSGAAHARLWSERFMAALAALREPAGADPLDSAGQQAWLRFVALLDEMGAIAGIAGTLTARQALAALRDLATRTTYQPATGDALVTIAALHDDPVVCYDGIWVAGLTAEAWPAPAMADPFIPLVALRDAGIAAASAAGQLAIARQSLAAWRAATGQLVLGAPTASGDMQLAPSPLLAEWPPRAAAQEPEERAAGRWLPWRLRRAPALEVLVDGTGTPWPAQQPLPGGTSALQHQADCPFRAYARQQLGAEPLEALRVGIEPDERGRWLHGALELFWREVGDSTRLAALAPQALQALARQAVEQSREPPPPLGAEAMAATRAREARRLVQLIEAFAALEATRAPFRVVGLEQQRQIGVGEARLDLRIDRIDELASGALAVIDYKSGRPRRLRWHGERPEAVQLLTYLAALGGEARALVNAHVTQSGMGYIGISAPDVSLPKVAALESGPGAAGEDAWAGQVGQWLAQLRALAAEFLRAEAAVTPAQSACRHCHLGSLCRVGERARLESGEVGDD